MSLRDRSTWSGKGVLLLDANAGETPVGLVRLLGWTSLLLLLRRGVEARSAAGDIRCSVDRRTLLLL